MGCIPPDLFTYITGESELAQLENLWRNYMASTADSVAAMEVGEVCN